MKETLKGPVASLKLEIVSHDSFFQRVEKTFLFFFILLRISLFSKFTTTCSPSNQLKSNTLKTIYLMKSTL